MNHSVALNGQALFVAPIFEFIEAPNRPTPKPLVEKKEAKFRDAY